MLIRRKAAERDHTKIQRKLLKCGKCPIITASELCDGILKVVHRSLKSLQIELQHAKSREGCPIDVIQPSVYAVKAQVHSLSKIREHFPDAAQLLNDDL